MTTEQVLELIKNKSENTIEAFNEYAEQYDELEKKYDLAFIALEEACKFLSNYPPAEAPHGEYYSINSCIVGSRIYKDAPYKYMEYFLDKATKTIKNLS